MASKGSLFTHDKLLGISSFAMVAALAQPAQAQNCPGVNGATCAISVTQNGRTVETQGATRITNTATGTTIVQTSNDFLLIDNAAGASIDSIEFAPRALPQNPAFPTVVRDDNIVINQGTINGDVVFANGGIYVNAGGRITGDLRTAFGSESFTSPDFFKGLTTEIVIDRAAGDVADGDVDLGNGVDFMAKSFSASGSYALPTALPLTVEGGGVEAIGAGTTVTITGEGSGIVLLGDGRVVNSGTIGRIDITRSGLPPAAFPMVKSPAIVYRGVVGQQSTLIVPIFTPAGFNRKELRFGSALESFANEGTIEGDITLNTAEFINSGEIKLRSNDQGTLILGAANRDFTFVNSGSILMEDSGLRDIPFPIAAISVGSAIDGTVPKDVSFLNDTTGLIEGGLAFQGIASDFRFENKGTISLRNNPNGIDRAVDLEVGGSEFLSNLGLLEDEIPADSVTIVNSGTLDGGINAGVTARTFTFTNSGTITSDIFDVSAPAVSLSMDDYSVGPDNDDSDNGSDSIDGERFDFVNSGTIEGRAELYLEASSVSITNEGEIAQGEASFSQLYPGRAAGLDIYQETNLDGTLVFSNSGTITTSDYAAAAVRIIADAGNDEQPGGDTAIVDVSFTNSGSLIASGGVFLTEAFAVGLPSGSNLASVSAGVSAFLSASGTTTLNIDNLQGGEIGTDLAPIRFGTFNGLFTLEETAAGSGIAAEADHISIDNAGIIRGGPGGSLINAATGTPSTLVFSFSDFEQKTAEELEFVMGGAIDTFHSEDFVVNRAGAVITGGIALRQGDDRLLNLGTINGDVHMGSGDDRFETLLASVDSRFTGIANGGDGDDSFVLLADQGGSLQDMGAVETVNFEHSLLGGTGTVTSEGAVSTVRLAAGADITVAEGSTVTAAGGLAFGNAEEGAQTLTNRGTITGSIELGGGSDRFVNLGSVTGDLDLGDGDDTFIQGINAVFTGTANGGAGTDSFLFDITGGGRLDRTLYDRLISFESLGFTGSGTIITDEALPIETFLIDSGAPVTFEEGSVLQTEGPVAVTGSAGNDDLTNGGLIIGAVMLGEGDNKFANTGAVQGGIGTGGGSDDLSNDGTISGDVATGGGDDNLVNTGTIGGSIYLDGTLQIDSEEPETGYGGGQNQARMRALAVAAEPVPTEGDDVFSNGGIVTGSVFAGGGNDRFTNSGSVGGDVDLGAGDDELVLIGDWAIGGSVFGGEGGDLVRTTFTGTDSEPQQVDFSRFQSIERFRTEGGTGAISGTASFEQIEVTAGRLIGLAGSTINGDVNVGTAAVFGSAGTVNGDIVVAGTLSPGASPGTMTINGDVSLLAGSNTLFEFTPAAGDAIVIDGALTIANGAQLTLTGERPLTPGTYNLVVASDGITGTFGSNVTRDSTVLGVLNYTPNAIQLLSTFQLRAGATAQSALTTAYLNTLLIGGTATPGIVATIPSLLDQGGYVSEAAIAGISPESYASAVEMGIENGLAISKAMRSIRPAGLSDESGIFVFGQAYANWRDFGGDARGVSSADVESHGFLGGVGFGTKTLGITAFIGKSDSKQRIGGIGARNDADGLFFGGKLHYASGGLEAGVTAIFDRSSADTVRTVAVAGSTARSHYRLRGTTLDAFASYGFDVGGGLRFGPEVGVTWISVKRGAVSETGGGAFALNVAAQRYDATFVTGGLKLSMPEATGAMRPWIAGGIRHRVSGDRAEATAAFAGVSTAYTINGVLRDKTVGYMTAGVEFQLSPSVALFAAGDIEIDDNIGAQNVNGGIRIKF